MQTNHQTGLNAEALAKQYLTQNNYQIMAERYCSLHRRSGAGEIDFVALKGNAYHFIEVKTRKTKQQALEALTPRQQTRLITAAQCYLAEHNLTDDTQCQFDYVIVVNKQVEFLANIIES